MQEIINKIIKQNSSLFGTNPIIEKISNYSDYEKNKV